MDEVLSERPRIVHVKKFLSDEEVSHLLKLAEGLWVPSTVVSNETGESVVDDYRTGQIACLDGNLSKDLPLLAVHERIASMASVRVAQEEGIQVVKYGLGQQYKPHFDWFDPGVPGPRLQLQKGGQRIRTVLIYLKQATKGGQTDFPRLKLKVRPEVGDAVFFDNLDPETLVPYQEAEHAGCPVEEGEKVVATCWIRERAFDGSEELPALTAKEESAKRVKDARAEAERANRLALTAMQEERKRREQECMTEIMAVADKHRCKIYGVPVAQINPQNGALHIGATVECDALPD